MSTPSACSGTSCSPAAGRTRGVRLARSKRFRRCSPPSRFLPAASGSTGGARAEAARRSREHSCQGGGQGPEPPLRLGPTAGRRPRVVSTRIPGAGACRHGRVPRCEGSSAVIVSRAPAGASQRGVAGGRADRSARGRRGSRHGDSTISVSLPASSCSTSTTCCGRSRARRPPASSSSIRPCAISIGSSQEDGADPTLREELAAAYIRVGQSARRRVSGESWRHHRGREQLSARRSRPSARRRRARRSSDCASRRTSTSHCWRPIRSKARQSSTGPLPPASGSSRANPDDVQTLRLMAQAYHGKATIAHVINHVPDHERAVARAVEIRERVLAISPGRLARRNRPRAGIRPARARARAKGAIPRARSSCSGRARAVLDAALTSAPSNQVVHSRSGREPLTCGVGAGAARAVDRGGRRARRSDRPAHAAGGVRRCTTCNTGRTSRMRGRAWATFDTLKGGSSEALSWHQTGADRATRACPVWTAPSCSCRGSSREVSTRSANCCWSSRRGTRMMRAARSAKRVTWPSRRCCSRPVSTKCVSSWRSVTKDSRRAALAGNRPDTEEATQLLAQSVATWREVFGRSVGDRRQASRLKTVEQLLASLVPPASTLPSQR